MVPITTGLYIVIWQTLSIVKVGVLHEQVDPYILRKWVH